MNLLKQSKNVLNVFLLGSAYCLLSTPIYAQMHKWVDAQGKIHFSDKPPPANAKPLQSKVEASSPSVVTTNLPPELAAPTKKNPVVLYTTATCGPCNDGRNLLKKNGIPFAEKTITSQDEVAKLKQISNDNQLPFLTINKSKFKGFDAEEWRSALNAAGYPDTNKLPKDFSYPKPEPLIKITDKNSKEPVDTSTQLTPNKASPTGIRF